MSRLCQDRVYEMNTQLFYYEDETEYSYIFLVNILMTKSR